MKEGQSFDIVISDYHMPEMNGVTFLKVLRDIQPDAVRFIMSGYADLECMVGLSTKQKFNVSSLNHGRLLFMHRHSAGD